MKKLSLIILLLIGINIPILAQLNGLYVRTGTQYSMLNESICFNKGRFEYMWQSDLAKMNCSGNYKVVNDTLILNSDLKINDLIQVKQHKLQKLDSVCISISTVSKASLIETVLLINDTIKQKINYGEQNLVKFPKGFIKTLAIRSLEVDWRISKLNYNIDQKTTFIEIILDDTRGLLNVFFDNEKYFIRQNRIISPDKEEYLFIKSPNGECK